MSRNILDDIINDFDPEKFIKFFRSKNTTFSPRQEDLTQYSDDNFKNGKKLGEINFKDNSLIIYSFQAEQALSEKTGKKAQYEKGKKILKETQADAGIFIYYDQSDNFRFSLIYANYLGSRRDWSTFRRFTYFVSKEFTNKTFLQRIGDGDFSNLEKIKDAFSVEKVTESFYTDIANWYFWAVQNITFPKDAEDEENGRNIAVIRLITRLIFIWFMKERGLVQSVLFEQSRIAQFLKDLSAEKTTYYKAILQNLFFSTLNTKIENRKYRFQESFQGRNKDYMDHSIYRYESYFKDNETMLTVFKDIPYLNGGLFDCLDRPSKNNENQGEIRIDGFTDKDVGLSVPNYLFFSDLTEADLNKDYGTKNNKYNVRGIINILSSYNFTIDENEPNDQEVALDPELLGKVFENLLASFNPETASTARKATGSYYTPREIVDYMVTQSLKNYLKTNLEESDELDNKIEQLFSNSNDTNPFNQEQTLKIVKLIDNLRIIDPAVGSGAFPMGVLNKLVFGLAKLDPNNTIWKETQLKAVESNVTDPILSKKLRDQIEEQFTQKNFDYGRKLYLIQKCIYGVDIQQIAVEIAKLRFFISLLVDEKIDKNKENWGIEPLPNLDYKIMQGNSLVEEYEGVKLFDERLLNAELPNEEEIVKTREKIKQIEKGLMTYYVKNPRWMKNFKLERPPELTILESERSRILIILRDLEKLQQSRSEQANQIKMSLQDDDGKSQKVWEELQKLHKQIFTPSLARDERNELRQKVDELEWKLIEETLREQNKIKELEKIKKLENSNTKPFFLWKLYFPEVFEEKGGFDIVIANPPYVDSETMTKNNSSLRDTYKRLFKSAKGNWDLFVIFIEKGFLLLKPGGVISYIVPNKLIGASYTKELRGILLSKNIKELRDYSRVDVFKEVSVYPIVFVAINNEVKEVVLFTRMVSEVDVESQYKINPELFYQDIYWDKYFLPQNKLDIILKLNTAQKLSKTTKKISDAASVSEAYEIKKYINELSSVQTNKYKKFINTGTIDPFISIWGKKKTQYIKKSYSEPVILDTDLRSLSKNRFEQACSNKLIISGMSKRIECFYDDGQYLAGKSTTIILEDEENLFLLKYLLAIMNSQLLSFWYTNYFSSLKMAGGYLNMSAKELGYLPIKELSRKEQEPFIEIVDKILTITNLNDYLTNSEKQATVKDYEKQIDLLVYDLYELTSEEKAIVEGKNES